MTQITKDAVSITIEAEDLYPAIADMEALLEYLKMKNTQEEFQKSVITAIETMEAFWCEHFAEDDDET